MSAGFETTDTLHYHSRAIRDGLKASINRLAHAKAHIPLPEFAASNTQNNIQQDWTAPASMDFDKDNDLQSDTSSYCPTPLFTEMRKALSDFETGPYDAAPPKERAFFSALRTLLSDISAVPDPAERTTRASAAHKWFIKHRPRGRAEDPAIFAAMAASLSLGGLQQQQLVGQQAGGHGGKAFSAQGTKHEFFASYSKEAPEGGGSAGPGSALRPRRSSEAPIVTAPLARVTASGVGGTPVVMQPAAPGVRATASARSAMAASSSSTLGTRGSRQSTVNGLPTTACDNDDATVPMPRGKSRVVFDPEHMGPASGGAVDGGGRGGRASQAPDWLSGPYKGAGRVANARDTIERMANRGMSPERSELEALRRKWSEMDAQSGKTAAGVESQVKRWSMQRARLEEEIIRRQEASRFASPSVHYGSGGGAARVDGGYMSPYRHVISDQLGLDSDGPSTQRMPGLVLPPTVTSIAREFRAHARDEADAELHAIGCRVAELGLEGVLDAAVLERALAPVPDKAYLDCLAKLPRPGEHLVSRPGSGAPRRPGSSGKKKVKSTAAKK